MSAWDDVPQPGDFATEKTFEAFLGQELEEYLRAVFADLRTQAAERAKHNDDGFLADEAGSPRCLAAGHAPDADGDWSHDGNHPDSYDGVPLCDATRYGSSCTECEGECDSRGMHPMSARSEFYALFAADNLIVRGVMPA